MYKTHFDTVNYDNSVQKIITDCNSIRIENKGTSIVTILSNISIIPGGFYDTDTKSPEEKITQPFPIQFDNTNTNVTYINKVLVIRKYVEKQTKK